MRLGFFKHWSQPPYTFVEFLRSEGIEIEEIDYSIPRYLEKYDVVMVEQNGFNDFIENDEPYITDWVKRGGIFWFMHQDYQRWAPYFLPEDLVGYTQLIHRHFADVRNLADANDEPYYCYMMPWIEDCGKALFNYPNKITPDDMLDWFVPSNSFRLVKRNYPTLEVLRTAAQSCFLANEKWDILGSYMDPAVRDGALILRAKCGKGMYFINQLLFPEVKPEGFDRCTEFWKKYIPNLLAYFERFRNGIPEPEVPAPGELAEKKNYKLCIHMHSLDWYGCDSAPGTINAMMRLMGFDICSLAVKDTSAYDGKLDPAKYSDEKVLFLDGQEFHPFNWKDRFCHVSHNNYHMLPIGIDHDSYTPEFTCSFHGDKEVDAYLKRAIKYVHDHHGAVCATHPVNVDYWYDYDYDAVDEEPLKPLSGSIIEKFWLKGGRKALMNSVDLFGWRRMLQNPAMNFVYLQGEKPCRDSVVKAIRNHHTIAATFFNEADVMLGDKLPGDVVSAQEAKNSVLTVKAAIATGVIKEVRVYSGAEVIFKVNPQSAEIDLQFPMTGITPDKFIRVEVEGEDPLKIMLNTPFFIGE